CAQHIDSLRTHLAHVTLVTSRGEQHSQDLATDSVIVHDQHYCTRIVRHLASSTSDGMRPVIVFIGLFLKTCDRRAAEKSDLVIGNESDSGYDCNSLYTYEVFIVARALCGLLARLML